VKGLSEIMVITSSFDIETAGNTDIRDITTHVQQCVNKSQLKAGLVNVSVAGSTGGITSLEFEPGLQRDLPQLLERLIPSNVTYDHDATWGDGNGHSHLRSSLIGTSQTFPFKEGNIILGTWQQIIFLDFDNRSRRRTIWVQIIGE
jgi:secondary thiamine-phosphate synthase enzyme